MELENFAELHEGSITFSVPAGEVLRLSPNGDVFVKGNLAANDKSVVDALRDWLQDAQAGARNYDALKATVEGILPVFREFRPTFVSMGAAKQVRALELAVGVDIDTWDVAPNTESEEKK